MVSMSLASLERGGLFGRVIRYASQQSAAPGFPQLAETVSGDLNTYDFTCVEIERDQLLFGAG